MSNEPTSINPYDPKRLRPKGSDGVKTSAHLHAINVHKPDKKVFFRVNSDPEFMTEAFVLEYEDDRGKDVLYLVDPDVADLIPDEVTIRRLFVCRSRRGELFLWPAKIPKEGGGFGQGWSTTAVEIADIAMKQWVRLVPDQANQQYYDIRAEEDSTEPEWPANLGLADLLALGFRGDRFIRSLDHPVVRERRGLS